MKRERKEEGSIDKTREKGDWENIGRQKYRERYGKYKESDTGKDTENDTDR